MRSATNRDPSRPARHELWPRIASLQLEALVDAADRPRRGVIVGTYGSGKSTMLHALRRRMQALEEGATGRVAEPPSSSSDLLLVDDAHLLAPAALDRLIARAEDATANVVISVGYGSIPPGAARLEQLLERSAPPIVLGGLDAADVRHAVAPECDARCVDAIIDRTGGIAWLVHAALLLHENGGCTRPDAHTEIDSGLLETVAHRLGHLAPDVRAYVESACFSPSPDVPDERYERAHAHGLVSRNGRPSPLVQVAVIASMTPERVAAEWRGPGLLPAPAAVAISLKAAGDSRAAPLLLKLADEALTTDPAHAATMFGIAAEAGAAGASVGQALALRALGRLDSAQALLESGAVADVERSRRAADTIAAIWAERGQAAEAHAVYSARGATGRFSELNAVLSGLAIGNRSSLAHDLAADAGPPTAADMSIRTLMAGLRATFGPNPAEGLPDLVRSSEVFTTVAGETPVVELPAVVAAIAAIGLGDLELADDVLAEALLGGQGGLAGRDHLRLWAAWVSLQRERPHDAQAQRAAALESPRPLGARDRVLAQALRLSVVRRYDDASALEIEWRRSRALLLRTRFDLFSLLPLTEFAITAARLKDDVTMDAHMAAALRLLGELDEPIGWSAHVRWAGVQRGILGNAPDRLAPHAHALVTASPRNPLAARMAVAGKIWTAVLAGAVDADAVENAALGLGTVGVAWDGARLAGHAAARSADRKAISQLLACARRLHPADGIGSPPTAGAPTTPRPHVGAGLSTRELEVADLVLQGKTYAEIGQAIFISPRTAEHHIARIRRRLGATSRSDLIAKLRQLLADPGTTSDRDSRPPSPHPLADAAMRGD